MRLTILQTSALIAGIGLLTACGGGGDGSTTAPPSGGPSPGGSTLIGDIQGNGATSPLEGQVVTVTGVVTGDFQDGDSDDRRNLGGFYLQDAPPDSDRNTSDGIFVFDGNNPAVDIDAGDVVEVQGEVTEFFGETQINLTSVRVVGAGSVIPTPINLPVSGTTTNSDGDVIADLERFEGMYVEFTDPLTVTGLWNLERFGAVTLSEGGRLYQFTNGNSPNAAEYTAHVELRARRSIELDDGLRVQSPDDIHYLAAGNTPGYSIRAGDRLTSLVGNLRYSRGSSGSGEETWRLVPTVDPVFESVNPRPGVPAVSGSVRAVGYNALNFFSTIDTGANICGPQADQSCRGADSNTELSRQLGKIVTVLTTLDADIIGLVELENNADASLRAIVNALNAAVGSAVYDYVDTGSIHDDAIKTGFIYRATTVATSGGFAILDRNVDSRYNDARNRPALAQTFTVDATGATLTVVVNHFKSKGSSCDADGDPNLGDGQGNCNITRTNAAAALADWIGADPTASGDTDFLVIGDLNAYTREDPLAAFESAGSTSLLGGTTDPYSFIFDGQAGALDHAIATPSLVPQVAETLVWHINADEPPLLDYNLENGRDPALFDANSPYRASDHDPIIIGLDLTN